MKSLFFGIFAIIVIAVLFFTFQIVKSPLFGALAVAPSANNGVNPGLLKTFVDIEKSFAFEFPGSGRLMDPLSAPGFAPILLFDNLPYMSRTGDVGYIAVGKKTLPRLGSVSEEQIEYSSGEAIKNTLASLLVVSPEQISLESMDNKRLLFKGGINGTIITFSVRENTSQREIGRASLYLYEKTEGLLYAFSFYSTMNSNPDLTSGLNGEVVESDGSKVHVKLPSQENRMSTFLKQDAMSALSSFRLLK